MSKHSMNKVNNKKRDVLPRHGLRHRLSEIKSMLIARDCTTQVNAASDLLKTLEYEASKDAKSTALSDFILKEDTISFLCEAMATTDCILLEKLVAILHILSLSEEMAKQRDSLCVAEATLRAAHFLAPLTSGSDGSQAADKVHAAALHLLAVILRRWTSLRGGRPVSEACRPDQLISCVKNIYTLSGESDLPSREGPAKETSSYLPSPAIVLLAAADALSAMIAAIAEETRAPSSANVNFSDSKSLVLVSTLVLDGILKLEGKDALEMMCRLTEVAVKYSASLFATENELNLKPDAQERISFVFFKDTVNRFVINVIDSQKYLAYQKTLCVVSALDVIMEVPISSPLRSVLAHRLASTGFLTLLPEIMHVPDDLKGYAKNPAYWRFYDEMTGDDCFRKSLSRNERNRPRVVGQFRGCGRRLLVSILTALASDLLPDSPFFEAQKLAASASALPNNVNDWGRLIASQNSWPEIRAFVLLWAYFVCVCCVGLQSVHQLVLTVLPHLSSYLTTFPKHHLMGLSQAWIKIIWLVFAVLSLCTDSCDSDTSKSNPSRLESASERLVTILESKESLKPVYTHNPALLFWIFTVDCPKLQREVVILWLEHEDSATVLGDLVRIRRDVAFRLLDVIQASTDVVTTRGAQLLELALTGTETAGSGVNPEEQKLCIAERFHLAATIWSILPTVLSRSTQSELDSLRANVFLGLSYRAATVASVSEEKGSYDVVAAEKIFGGREVRTACHLATLLASFADFSSPSPVCQQNGLQVALLLLRFSQHRVDSRVFTVFADHKNLTKVLVSSITSETPRDPRIVVSSTHLLTTMLKCQKFFGIAHTTECAIILSDEILRLLEKCGQIAAAIVEMLQAELELLCNIGQPLLQLDNTAPTFWRALFLRLQMMCAKDIPEISLPAWNCLSILLTSEICDSDTRRHLATQPWTHFLLRTVLASGPSKLATVLRQQADVTVKTPSGEIVRFILAWLRATRELNHRFRTVPTPDFLTETCSLLGSALFRWTSKNRHCSTNERAIAQELLSCGAILPPEIVDGIRETLSLLPYDVNE